MYFLKQWFRRTFSDPEVILLGLLLVGGFAIVLLFGEILVPVLAALVLAYLLEGVVTRLERRGLSRTAAVVLVFAAFSALVVTAVLLILPLLIRQVTQLIQILPQLVVELQQRLVAFTSQYPELFSPRWVTELLGASQVQVSGLAQRVVTFSAASLVGLATFLLYAVLVPLLVFFFLKDKRPILDWTSRFVPRRRGLAVKVWREVDLQMGNYVRGKFLEILIVWSASVIAFAVLGMPFSVLLGLIVGLSVLVPYIGAAVVTIPVALVAYFQWGFDSHLVWVIVTYGVLQALDGNLLAPLLFSEVVHLHPVAIIVAVLFFGGVWGFWGVFFAIPLATLVKAVVDAWPRVRRRKAMSPEPA